MLVCFCGGHHNGFDGDFDCFLLFFFNDTATHEIYTLSLHDALPIPRARCSRTRSPASIPVPRVPAPWRGARDRKSTRLNSSHITNSYAVFCVKKKNLVPDPHRRYADAFAEVLLGVHVERH